MLNITSCQTGRIEKTWSFDLTIPADLRSEIAFVLARPLVFELYGAGFTRRKGSSLYELRFPRVSAIHESRKPSEAVTLSELQKLAKESSSWIGSEAESEVDDMWSRHSSGSGGETSGGSANDWRSRQENHWIKKLTRACQPRARRLKPQRGEQGRTFTSQTTPNSAPEVQNAMSSEKARLLSDKSNGFDEEQPYLWTCLPFHLASQIHLPVAYRVASVQSLFFTVSSLRKASAPVQAVILLEEPLTLEGKTWLRELVDCFRAEGADIGGTSQVWIQPLPRVCNDSGYNVESLNVETMRKLEPLD